MSFRSSKQARIPADASSSIVATGPEATGPEATGPEATGPEATGPVDPSHSRRQVL